MRCLSQHPGNAGLRSCRVWLLMKRALLVPLYGLKQWPRLAYPEYENFDVVKMKVIPNE